MYGDGFPGLKTLLSVTSCNKGDKWVRFFAMAVILQNNSVRWRITAFWFFYFLTFTTEKLRLIVSYGKMCHFINNSVDGVVFLNRV